MFKLVALDIDGTLLDKDHVLRDEVMYTVNKVKEKGIKVVLASGRDYKALKPFLHKLGVKDLVIGMNGCRVYNKEGKTIFNESIDSIVGKEIINFFQEEKRYIILFIDGNTYVAKFNNYLDHEYYTGIPIEVENLSHFYKEHMNLDKIIVVEEHEKLLEIKDILNKNFKGKINGEFTLSIFLEIFSNKVNKGVMLEKIAKYYNIERNEVMAIGDWDNDIPMIEYAGFGVAMGNASDGLKERADFITKSNEENGVAYALQKFILDSD